MRVVALALVSVALAGCSGSTGGLPESALPRLVLQPGDLPPAFDRFDEGRLAKADQPGGRRAQPGRFGRQGGWKARYRRPGDAETPGPLVIESRADLFDSDGGAKDEVDAIRGERGTVASDRNIGDETLLTSTTQPGFPRPLRIVTVTWRTGNVVASVTVNGFQGRVREQGAFRLARLQQVRIVAAAG